MDVLRKKRNPGEQLQAIHSEKQPYFKSCRRITKPFTVNFSNREKPIFSSVRKCMDSILFYDIKENMHNEREAELTPLTRKSTFFIEETVSLLMFILW